MKRRVLTWVAIWLVVITFSHVWLNIGFERASHNMQVALGNERPELIVGFLPVT
ncbi:MAG: hypothetical protein ACI9F9_000306 [Candidatus Paceibacteria bacterium]|jgi:hypothetical protein